MRPTKVIVGEVSGEVTENGQTTIEGPFGVIAMMRGEFSDLVRVVTYLDHARYEETQPRETPDPFKIVIKALYDNYGIKE